MTDKKMGGGQRPEAGASESELNGQVSRSNPSPMTDAQPERSEHSLEAEMHFELDEQPERDLAEDISQWIADCEKALPGSSRSLELLKMLRRAADELAALRDELKIKTLLEESVDTLLGQRQEAESQLDKAVAALAAIEDDDRIPAYIRADVRAALAEIRGGERDE